MLSHKPNLQSSPNWLRSPPHPPYPQCGHPGLGDPQHPSLGMWGALVGAQLLLLPQRCWVPMGRGPWGGHSSSGCFWMLVGVGGSHWPPSPLPTPPGCRDGGAWGDNAQEWGSKHGTDSLVVTPWHLWRCHQQTRGHRSAAATTPSTRPAPWWGQQAREGSAGRGAGRAGSGGGDPSGRLDLEGSLEPAESIILRGMQFPQQRRVRGQRGEPAAPLGTAAVPPPLPKRRRGEVAGEVRMARPGR